LVIAANAPDLPTLVLRAIETRKTIAPRVENRLRPTTPSPSSRHYRDVDTRMSSRRPTPYTDGCAREDRTVAGHFA